MEKGVDAMHQQLAYGTTIVLVLFSVGCAHVPLARNTLKQVQTVADIQEQQVLDNIARAVAEPDSTPFYSVPKAGSTQVSQNGAAAFDSLGILSH